MRMGCANRRFSAAVRLEDGTGRTVEPLPEGRRAGNNMAWLTRGEADLTFTKRLRDGVRRGEITCSVRIWTRPHVKTGGRYRMEEGEIEVDSIEPIGLPD